MPFRESGSGVRPPGGKTGASLAKVEPLAEQVATITVSRQSPDDAGIREIFVSDAYPELAVIVHPRVPAATVEKVRQAFLGMRNDPSAAPVLIRVKFKGFEPATDRDYDEVRRVYRQIGQ